ncbi:MAG: UDP-N-acetylmuramoyl-L-alanyl-D-glutamate--2,6-diaminopimelate ligase [bacterium]|nr:UDP-N-acetylmuramoyl-L-alanyl-D-glutamate--2,6-diaminopimelate ligase [bacterium]
MLLSALALLIPGCRVAASIDPEITRVDYDSRKVVPGSLFVAVAGEKTDGHLYLDQAFGRGAAAAVVEKISDSISDKPMLVASDTRQALALIAGELAGHPDRDLDLVALTGTNGKTTTAYLLANVFTRHYGKSGLIGTVGNRIGDTLEPQERTTPEAPELYDLIQRMKWEGCGAAAMEVSSHAMALQRVYGLTFKAAAFTNLSQDHLDFHGNLESYFKAKALLFSDYSIGSAIINSDDAYGQRLLKLTSAPVLTYSLLGDADVQAESLQLSVNSIRLEVHTPRGRLKIESPLVGRFNAYNLLCGLAVAEALSIPHDQFLEVAAQFQGAPGRLERFDLGNRWVYVDYAHTPEAIEQVARELKKLSPGPLHILFGCGGNRDRAKRPLMGRAAEKYADRLIITTDNPRDEDPVEIIEEIKLGLDRSQEARIIVDRREAIELALRELPEQGVLLIAGKGHETYQDIQGKKHHFDDREEVRRIMGKPSA